jgi:hypothetical protein
MNPCDDFQDDDTFDSPSHLERYEVRRLLVHGRLSDTEEPNED